MLAARRARGGGALGRRQQRSGAVGLLHCAHEKDRAQVLSPHAARRAQPTSETKKPDLLRDRAFLSACGLAVTYFRVRNCTLSSAQTRFTVLFGMGRRGARLLWPPGRRLKK